MNVAARIAAPRSFELLVVADQALTRLAERTRLPKTRVLEELVEIAYEVEWTPAPNSLASIEGPRRWISVRVDVGVLSSLRAICVRLGLSQRRVLDEVCLLGDLLPPDGGSGGGRPGRLRALVDIISSGRTLPPRSPSENDAQLALPLDEKSSRAMTCDAGARGPNPRPSRRPRTARNTTPPATDDGPGGATAPKTSPRGGGVDG